ncbi:MAG: hypothetical protein HQL46_08735 [Gammaproteobacteria bacterium]|nr:hypothetical protein [Gammaproteobacteria bacterium]
MTLIGILIVLGLIFFIYIAKVIFSVYELIYFDKNEPDKQPWKNFTEDDIDGSDESKK